MTGDPFGVWLRIEGVGEVHYFLPGAGRCLCRAHKRPDPEVRAVLSDNGRVKHEDTVDPDCLEANESRWLTMYPRGRAK